jgi:hypothetical protein
VRIIRNAQVQNEELLIVEARGAYSYQLVFKGLSTWLVTLKWSVLCGDVERLRYLRRFWNRLIDSQFFLRYIQFTGSLFYTLKSSVQNITETDADAEQQLVDCYRKLPGNLYLQTLPEHTANHGLNINCLERLKATYNSKITVCGRIPTIPEVVCVSTLLTGNPISSDFN